MGTMSSRRELSPSIRLVSSIGYADGKVYDPAAKRKTRMAVRHGYFGNNAVKCPSCAKPMTGKIAREGLWCTTNCCTKSCHECDTELLGEHAMYECHDCTAYQCIQCSRQQLGLPVVDSDEPSPPLELLPGDVLLAWPNVVNAHHAILVTGEMFRDPGMDPILEVPPGVEVWGCATVESTGMETGRDCGDNSWWVKGDILLARDQVAGTCELVGDIRYNPEIEREEINLAEKPIPVKILLHPLRREFGGPGLDLRAFEGAVQLSLEKSQAWNVLTCTNALIQGHELQESDFPSAESLATLMDSFEAEWDKPPICSSVPIKVWQRYFLATSQSREEAAQKILAYMPCYCSTTTPAFLTTVLSGRGWVLEDCLEP